MGSRQTPHPHAGQRPCFPFTRGKESCFSQREVPVGRKGPRDGKQGQQRRSGHRQITWGVGHWNSSRTKGLAHFTMLK